MKIERVIVLSLVARTWQAAAGLVTIPFVIRYLSEATQGYYYTFSSLVALQSFFELGISIVISVYASHEWHNLRRDGDGRIEGDQESLSRLTSLGRFVFAYSTLMFVTYVAVVGVAGYQVLASGRSASMVWVWPWLFHVVLSAVQLACTSVLSLLEGCGQIASVAAFRLTQSLVSNVVLWVALAGGLELWAIPAYSLVSVLALVTYLSLRHGRFLWTFSVPPKGDTLSWKHDLFPMQWRLAVQGLFSYMSFPLFTSLAYVYLGVREAGQLGMTFQVVSGIQTMGLVFLTARAPQFSRLAAAGMLDELSRGCKQATLQCMAVMASLAGLCVSALLLARAYHLPRVDRVQAPAAFLILSVGIVTTGAIQGIALFLRAQKRELLTPVGVLVGCLYGVLGWRACLSFGAGGFAWSYTGVTVLVALPLAFFVLWSSQQRPRAVAG